MEQKMQNKRESQDTPNSGGPMSVKKPLTNTEHQEVWKTGRHLRKS